MSNIVTLIATAVAAVLDSDKYAPKTAWADKWKHGYIGCRLARAGAWPHEIIIIAFAKELIDALGFGTPSIQDYNATLWGYQYHYWGRVRRGWWIFSWWEYRPCHEVCNAYNNQWIQFHNAEHGT